MIKILFTLFSLATMPSLVDGSYSKFWRGQKNIQKKTIQHVSTQALISINGIQRIQFNKKNELLFNKDELIRLKL